jgi:AP-3 complex subunit mu
MPPVISTSSQSSLVSIYAHNIFIVAVVRREVQALLVLEFLHRINDVMKHYFSVVSVSESTIKKNFSTVYQILEEMSDNGFPFVTEPNMLTAMVAPPSMLGRMKSSMLGQSSVAQALPRGTLTQVPWRKAGVKYRNNQILFDVFEDVNSIVDSKGRLVCSHVTGVISCESRLSGLPDLCLSFVDPDVIKDCSFHPCVRYGRFETSKVVSFVPPDGEFRLMRYRVSNIRPAGRVEPPVYCRPTLTYDQDDVSAARLHISLKLRRSPSVYASKMGKIPSTSCVEVRIPFPSHRTSSVSISSTFGKANYNDETNMLIWTLKGLKDRMTPSLTGRVVFKEEEKEKKKRKKRSKVSLKALLRFKIQDATISGLHVDKLNLTNERYKPYKGVRSMVRAGTYEIRM